MVPVNSFVVLGCGAAAIAAGNAIYARVAILRRCLIPPPILAGLILAAPTLWLRNYGIELEVDSTLRELSVVALFTSIGFNLDREALRRGGRPVAVILAVFWLGAILQNIAGISVARAMGVHPLLGVAGGAVAFAGGPATSLAFGPTLEDAGARGATSAALALAITGILIGGFTTGAFGAFCIRKDNLRPSGDAEAPEVSRDATPAEPASEIPRSLLLFGLAMGAGYLINLVLNHWMRGLGITLPGYSGAMIAAALIRTRLSGTPAWSTLIGTVSLTWFIPLALWTLRYWELAGLATPLLAILVVQVPLTLALGWLAYQANGRNFDSAFMAAGYYGFMIGTMANSLAGIEELRRRFGPSPKGLLVISLAGGVLSDFFNIVTIVLSRAWLATR